jgi:RNA polymerase sigma-70 factor (ECF subfamily)
MKISGVIDSAARHVYIHRRTIRLLSPLATTAGGSRAPQPRDVRRTLGRRTRRLALGAGAGVDEYHFYLLQIARRELTPDLQPKGGASDLVQETFLEAQQAFGRFEGRSADELRAWLRCLLLHHTAKVGRRFRTTRKRRLSREVSLDAPGQLAAAANGPAAAPSPSAHLLARERHEVLLQALDRLPDDYRRVMLLRYQKELTFEEIGRDMRRSGDAVRMLWARALERLKYELRPFREGA